MPFFGWYASFSLDVDFLATENNFVAYGSLTAQAFDAELHLEAWSGKGVVRFDFPHKIMNRNYGYPNITSPDPLPSYWNLTLANNASSLWDFSSWIPDAVVINLGTNDYSTQPSPPQNIFEGAYKEFVSIMQKQYSPQTPIFLVCGPMIGMLYLFHKITPI